MGYSIKVLKNEEFDRLPYLRAREAFGVTDTKTNQVFVRHTNLHDFNKMLVSHEMDHLVEEVATDEGPDGERYFLGGLLSGLGGFAKAALPFIGGGLKTAGSVLASPISGAAKLIGGGAGSLMNMFGGGGGSSSGGNSGGPGFKSGFGSGFGTATNRQPNQSFTNLFGSKAGDASGGILNSFLNPQTLLGAGSLVAGLGKKVPKAPPLPQSVEDLRGQVQAGGSPLGQLAQGKLTEQLNENYDPLAQPEIDAALRELERNQVLEEDKVRDLYRNLRPGTDPSTDSAFQRDLATVSDQFSRAKADTLATRTRDTKAIFDQQRGQQIQQALGASDQQMARLSEIAQLDVAQIMTQLNLDFTQAQAFKETFLGLGNNLLLSGLGAQPNILSLFGGQ